MIDGAVIEGELAPVGRILTRNPGTTASGPLVQGLSHLPWFISSLMA